MMSEMSLLQVKMKLSTRMTALMWSCGRTSLWSGKSRKLSGKLRRKGDDKSWRDNVRNGRKEEDNMKRSREGFMNKGFKNRRNCGDKWKKKPMKILVRRRNKTGMRTILMKMVILLRTAMMIPCLVWKVR